MGGEDGLEASRERYMRAPERIRALAEDVVGLSIPDTTTEQWKLLLSSIRIVDDRLDHLHNPQERVQLTENIKVALQHGTSDFSGDPDFAAAMNDVQTLLDGLPEEKRTFFVRSLSVILTVTEKVKQEKDPRKFTELRRLEGQLTSKVFLPFLPDSYVQSDKYPQLVHFFSRLGRLANTFDTLVDWDEDHRLGQTIVKPSALNRLRLVGALLIDTGKLLKHANISGELLRQLSSSTRSTIADSLEGTKKKT